MLGAELDFQAYRQRLHEELDRVDSADLRTWSDLIFDRYRSGRFVYVIGNGGSGTTASHMAEDLGKSTLRPADLRDESKQRLKVLSLTDNAG
jgi:D-sedoheptulose 7-phosphate isomerase